MMLASTKHGPIVVSVIVAVTFGVVLFILLTKVIPGSDSDLMKILTGTLSAKFGDVVNFWIGSSSGSKAKDEILSGNQKQGGG